MAETKWVFRGIPCADRLYCGNGGACTHFPKLNVRACNCTEGFEGARCEFTSTAGDASAVMSGNSDQDILRIFLFISNCLILITLIAILIVLCRRTSPSRKTRRWPSAEDNTPVNAGRFRLTRIRRAIGWQFRRDLNSTKPDAAPVDRERQALNSKRQTKSKWTSVRQVMVPSLTDIDEVRPEEKPRPPPRSRWTSVRETMVPSLDVEQLEV